MVCQQAKTERTSPAGLLQPLPIPKKPWAVVSLDFIEGLPKSSGYDAILVVVDKILQVCPLLTSGTPIHGAAGGQAFHERDLQVAWPATGIHL